MTIRPSPHPTPLTFPPHLFAKLSPHAYQTAHLTHTPRLRPSGRTPTQCRGVKCNTGSLTHAHGSALVRNGDTAVVCGVRPEILRVEDVVDYAPRVTAAEIDVAEGGEERESERGRKRRKREKADTAEMAALGLLVPNIELATGCSPAHLPGGPPSAQAQVLTQRLLTLLHTSQILGMEGLRIWHRPPRSGDPGPQEEGVDLATPVVKAFWTLHISLVFISLDAGALDTAWLALVAALRDTKLPRAWYDADAERVLCSPDSAEEYPLVVRRDMPVALTFGVFEYEDRDEFGKPGGGGGKGNRRVVLSDPDAFEEALCAERLTVVVGGNGRIVRLEKVGGGAVGVGDVRGCVELAGKRREECLLVLGGVE